MKNKYYDMYIKYIQVSLHRRDIHSLYIHNMHRHVHEHLLYALDTLDSGMIIDYGKMAEVSWVKFVEF